MFWHSLLSEVFVKAADFFLKREGVREGFVFLLSLF